MTPRVEVNPALLHWACERNGNALEPLSARFPNLLAWALGGLQPTLKQLETFANATHTPIGYFFLPEPPEEAIPIPDFRAPTKGRTERPSPDLLETIYICQQRQEWYRDFARATEEEPLSFVGSASITDDVVTTAKSIRDTLGLDLESQRKLPNWTDALRAFIERADEAGLLVMCSGVVLNNSTRKLDPAEFRGFAISDDLAPVIFVNGADTKAAQTFTLAFELAHIWLGQSAVSNAQAEHLPRHEPEHWCHRVAAELLAPLGPRCDSKKEPRCAQLRLSLDFQVSRRFARALVVSTLEGQTLHRDAFRMLGIAKHASFQQLSISLGANG